MTTQITIQGLQFDIPQPYAEGHPLTHNEAAALNQVYGENLRNNFAKRVRDAVEKAGNPEAVDVASLQADLDAYVSEYEFGVRRAGTPRGSVDPVEAEAFKIAMETVKGALRANGFKLSDVSTEQKAELAQQLIDSNPQIREEAVRRVEQAKAIGKQTINLANLGLNK